MARNEAIYAKKLSQVDYMTYKNPKFLSHIINLTLAR